MALKRLSDAELRDMIDESFDRVRSQRTSNADDTEATSLLASAIAANSQLEESTLAGEPEGLLTELAVKLVPEYSANSEIEQLSPYSESIDSLWDRLDVGTGVVDVHSRSESSDDSAENVTPNTAGQSTDAGTGMSGEEIDIDDLDIGTGEVDVSTNRSG